MAADYPLLAITESWLQDNVLDGELFSSNYMVFRCDRNRVAMNVSRGGGVLLAVSTELKATQLDLRGVLELNPKVDIVGSKVVVNFKPLFIFVIYIPPSLAHAEILSFFESIRDFNLPAYHSKSIFNDGSVQILLDFSIFLNLIQFNNILNSNQRTLDLVLSNLPCNVTRDLLSFSPDNQHPALCIDFPTLDSKVKEVSAKSDTKRFNFRRADFPKLYNLLADSDWSKLDDCSSVDDAYDHLYSSLYTMFDQ